jgi:acyl carrier protein
MTDYVCRKILEYVDVEKSSITEDTNLALDLHMNSYDCVSIVGSMENELGIEIPDIDIRNLQTVGSISEYLKKKMNSVN